MDNKDNKRVSSAAVDNILDSLKGRGDAAGGKGRNVDDILAEIAKKPVAGKTPPAPAEAPAPKAGQTERFIVPTPAPEPKAEAKKADPPAPAKPAAPPQNAPPKADDDRPAPASLFDDGKARAAGKSAAGQTTIWDIQTEHTRVGPRTGKAAALERVEQDKFVGDEELNRWFGSEEPLSKKEQRQLAKEEKKRLAAERKEEKRLGRRSRSVEDEDDGWQQEEENELGDDLFAAAALDAAKTGAFTAVRKTESTAVLFDERGDAAAMFREQSVEERHVAPSAAAPADTGVDEPDAFLAETEDTRSAAGIGLDDEPLSAAEIGATQVFTAPTPGEKAQDDHAAFALGDDDERDTRSFELDGAEAERVPTAAFTQEFEAGEIPPSVDNKSLFVDDMVDDRFRQFFSETVVVDREEVEAGVRTRRRKKKSRSAILTGEFAKLAELAEASEYAEMTGEEPPEEEEFDDYNRPQDAPAIEEDIAALCTTLTRRTIFSFVIGALLLWVGLSFSGTLPMPAALSFAQNPFVFIGIYLVLILGVIALNFTTVATGLAGLFSEPTTDSAPALAALGALLQGVLLLIQQLLKVPVAGTLFGAMAAFILGFNALGKRVRAVSILRNFKLASAGLDHSAAYILDDRNELAFNITNGLEEQDPILLISRPTALVKGFLRQSFSQRNTDRTGRMLGWAVLAVGLVAGILTFFVADKSLFAAVSALAAVLCIAAPFSSTLVSGIPSLLMQKSTARVGAVVPGWSAIEELGDVNVVMATARDIFPPSAVYLKGIKTFEKERIDLAILYAASVLIEGCDTLRDIFVGVIQGKHDMLYKVESLTKEPGRGFTAWVQNNRVVIGSREMLQKHDIAPPPIELEMKHVPDGHMPVYLAVSGKLFAMFIVGYGADDEVEETLSGLVKSGVSLLVTSDDMNVTAELIEHAYRLPHGVVKVMGRRELDILEPLTSYTPESEGVMTHMGTFSSFIGGMRAAAGCAVSERMSSIVQIASVALACVLSLLLTFSSGLAGLSIAIALLYQLGWTLLIGLMPFARRY